MSTPATRVGTPVAPGNVEQARAWDGEEGEHWADHADHYDRAVAGYREDLAVVAAVRPDDAVLDVGCGNGATTIAAAQAAHEGSALGVDLSARMLETARARAAAAGVSNARFQQADAQVHEFGAQAFDLVLSRFGAMFFSDPAAAFTRLAAATRPSGRLALLAWQGLADNEWLREIRTALAAGRELPGPGAGTPSPFGLSEPAWVRRLLLGSGWVNVDAEPVERPMRFGSDAADALAFLRGTGAVIGLLQDLDVETARRAEADLHQRLAAHETPDGVLLDSAAWLITARRAPERS